MHDTVVLGGWAVKPDILKPVFGESACYVDVNRLMPMLDSEGAVRDDWAHISATYIRNTGIGRNIVLAGWSTGAMIAWGVAELLNAKRLYLLSVTPSFCRTPDFKHGVRRTILDSMISSLHTDTRATLRVFYERCGLPFDSGILSCYSPDELLCGLRFLRQVTLFPLKPTKVCPHIIHGREDVIIPSQAGKAFAQECSGVYRDFAGPHAFFTPGCREVKEYFATVERCRG